jgi:hypothetical protein
LLKEAALENNKEVPVEAAQKSALYRTESRDVRNREDTPCRIMIIGFRRA